MDIEFRQLLPSDIRAWAHYESTVSASDLQALLHHSSHHWMLILENTAVGFAALSPLPGLNGLFALSGEIAAPFRRRGLGRQLLHHLIATRPQTVVTDLSVAVAALNTPAALFLQNSGFKLTHTEWQMRHDLSPNSIPRPYPVSTAVALTKLSHCQTGRQLPALYDRCFAQTAWYQPYTPAEIRATLAPQDELWVLKKGSASIGFAWLHFPPRQGVEIEPMGIVADQQGRGYGRFLLSWLLADLNRRGVTAVQLGVWQINQKAIRLYRSLGFRQTGQTFYLSLTLSQA